MVELKRTLYRCTECGAVRKTRRQAGHITAHGERCTGTTWTVFARPTPKPHPQQESPEYRRMMRSVDSLQEQIRMREVEVRALTHIAESLGAIKEYLDRIAQRICE